MASVHLGYIGICSPFLIFRIVELVPVDVIDLVELRAGTPIHKTVLQVREPRFLSLVLVIIEFGRRQVKWLAAWR
jgi:hypothetical protein